jgi:hypothetical protein
MAETLAGLRSLSDEDIIARHDRAAEHTSVGVVYYLAELGRRDQNRQTEAMLAYTRSIKTLTLIVTIATIVNVLVAVAAVCATMQPR